ncbi:MAG: hypothetical protein J2P15_12950 [Micromonosporaceae bacterium]|nr:hypothetical protein [Micromonosporaceae bacterium]
MTERRPAADRRWERLWWGWQRLRGAPTVYAGDIGVRVNWPNFGHTVGWQEIAAIEVQQAPQELRLPGELVLCTVTGREVHTGQFRSASVRANLAVYRLRLSGWGVAVVPQCAFDRTVTRLREMHAGGR